MYIQAEATKNREWKILRMGNSFVLFTKLLMRIFKFTKACDQKFTDIHNNFQGALIQTQDLKD